MEKHMTGNVGDGSIRVAQGAIQIQNVEDHVVTGTNPTNMTRVRHTSLDLSLDPGDPKGLDSPCVLMHNTQVFYSPVPYLHYRQFNPPHR